VSACYGPEFNIKLQGAQPRISPPGPALIVRFLADRHEMKLSAADFSDLPRTRAGEIRTSNRNLHRGEGRAHARAKPGFAGCEKIFSVKSLYHQRITNQIPGRGGGKVSKEACRVLSIAVG
jgi:hypothetical protein